MKIPHFDRLVWAALAVLGLALAIILIIFNQSGVSIVKAYPLDGTQIGPWGKVGVEFGQAMVKDLTEKVFKITPEIAGQFQWDGKTLWFEPREPFKAGGNYSASVTSGAPGTDGRKLKKNFSWKFTIRSPSLIYISPAQEGSDLWYKDVGTGNPQKLTDTANAVQDFAVSRDGETIAYTLLNDQNGADIWLMPRDGANHTLLLSCGADQCSQPAWSWNSDRIAFSRKSRKNGPNSAFNAPRVWTIEVTSGQSAPLFQDASITGDSPNWSPEGKYLAFYDTAHQSLHVLNLQNSKDTLLQTQIDQVIAWSPDGNQLLFVNELSTGEQSYLSVYSYDMTRGKGGEPFKDSLAGLDASIPDWSADGQSVVLGLRSLEGGQSKQLWVLGFKQEPPVDVTDNQIYTQAAYHWNNQGTAIVYQRFELGRSDSQPEVLVWDKVTHQSQVIAQNAALPAWLP